MKIGDVNVKDAEPLKIPAGASKGAV